MAALPPALLAPPPRDPAAAAPLVAGFRRRARGGFVALAGATAMPVILALGLGSNGLYEVEEIYLWLSPVYALIALFIVAMFVGRRRARRIYRDGVLVTGTVRAVSGGGGWATYTRQWLPVIIDVEYATGPGRVVTGRFTTTSPRTDDCRAGDQLPVLYVPGVRSGMAVFVPSLGLVPGVPLRRPRGSRAA